MMRRRSDIPLESDATSRLLPWIIAVMVFLAALALAGSMALSKAVTAWTAGVSGTVTVQVPPGHSAEETDARLAKAVEVLEAAPGIARVRVLDRNEVEALLAPWLGDGADAAALPIPRLIDARADPTVADLSALSERLASAVPGASVDDHRKWLGNLASFAGSLEWLSIAVVALIGAAAAITVIFATRAGLAVHHRVIEVLHLIGARDAYIARQFQRQAMRLGLLGGVLGLAAAVASLLALSKFAGRIPLFDALEAEFAWRDWALLGILPIVTTLIATVTARATVMRTLSRLT